MNEDLHGVKMYCVIDGNEIPAERLRFRSVTCSKGCYDLRARMLRKKTDDKECRFCHKPSTVNARKAFSRFHQWTLEFADLAYPAQWAILAAAGMKLADLRKVIAQARKYDVAIDTNNYRFDWDSTKMKPDGPPLPEELARALAILAAHYEANPPAPGA